MSIKSTRNTLCGKYLFRLYIDFPSHSFLRAVQVYVVVVFSFQAGFRQCIIWWYRCLSSEAPLIGRINSRASWSRVCTRSCLSFSARDIWAREFKPQQYQYCPTVRILVHIHVPSRKLRGNFAGINLRITNSSFQARKTIINSKHTVFYKGIAMFPTKAIILVLLFFGSAGKTAFKCYAIAVHEIQTVI